MEYDSDREYVNDVLRELETQESKHRIRQSEKEISPMCDICGDSDFGTKCELAACGWTFGNGAEFCPNCF